MADPQEVIFAHDISELAVVGSLIPDEVSVNAVWLAGRSYLTKLQVGELLPEVVAYRAALLAASSVILKRDVTLGLSAVMHDGGPVNEQLTMGELRSIRAEQRPKRLGAYLHGVLMLVFGPLRGETP